MAKLLEMPNVFNPNAAGMPQWQLGQNQAPPQELESVHGGTAVSAHGGQTGVASGAGDARSNKWAISVMALAAVLGVIAAVVMQTRSKHQDPAENAVAENQDGSAKPAPTPNPPATTNPPTTNTATPTANPPPTDPNEPVDLTPRSIPGDPNVPLDLTAKAPTPTAPPTQTPPVQPTTQAPPVQPTTQPPTTTAQVAPPPTPTDELPKLTDPSTTAPDADSLAKKQAAEAAKEEAKKKSSARLSPTPPSRQNPRRDRDTDDDPPKKSAKPSDEMGFLRVSAYPAGWVSVDGGPKKPAPASIQVTAGKHKVRIFTDYESKIRSVTIEAGEVKIIKVDWDANAIQED
jgi:hypothetical protein